MELQHYPGETRIEEDCFLRMVGPVCSGTPCVMCNGVMDWEIELQKAKP